MSHDHEDLESPAYGSAFGDSVWSLVAARCSGFTALVFRVWDKGKKDSVLLQVSVLARDGEKRNSASIVPPRHPLRHPSSQIYN